MRIATLTVVGLLFSTGCRDKSGSTDSGQVDEAEDVDQDGITADRDCDDGDPAVYPGAAERCDGIDNDCDGDIDEGLSSTWYGDADGDGAGAADAPIDACEAPDGAVADAGDCDDDRADVHPDAEELCDGRDNNCDGDVDEGLMGTWYADSDGDGFGDPSAPVETCDPSAGVVGNDSDCDDTNAAAFPGADELCDGVDNDCDGDVDGGALDMRPWYGDGDGDGYGDAADVDWSCDGTSDRVDNASDCDDADALTFPGADERCDGADNDCDGVVDESDAVDAEAWYADTDADGFGDAAVTTVACDQPANHVADDTDCDDGAVLVFPGAAESCNGLDDDCDGSIDEAGAVDETTWYADADGDGYGLTADTTDACDQPSGYAADSGDCDDVDAAVNPGATELCDSVDNDCDGDTDESGSADATTWYTDADGDGYGVSASAVVSCSGPSGTSDASGDCDDIDATVSPAAVEMCDAIDNDCDGSVDESDAADATLWYADNDGDGFGDAATSDVQCDAPSGYVADATDCDDTEIGAYPGSVETETPGDGVDQDCDGVDACTDLDCDGLPDMVVGEYYAGSYTTAGHVYVNAGGFDDADRTDLQTYGTYDTQVADFDGDGYQDILFVNYFDGSTRLIDSYVYWGSVTGYATGNRTELPTVGALAAAVADLDGDGYLDIAFANHYDDSSYDVDSYVYYGSASGFSTADRVDLETYGARKVLAEDLNGDGEIDLVYCNYRSDSGGVSTYSYVYWGSSAGYATSNRSDLPTSGCRGVDAGDMNGDGYLELAFANHYGSGTYATDSYVYWGYSGGYSTAYRDDLATHGSLSAEIEDLDADGYPDVVFGGYRSSGWSSAGDTRVYWNSSLGLSTYMVTELATLGAWDVHSADLDNDGYPDLIVPRYYGGSSYSTDSYVFWGSASGYSDADRTDIPTVGATRISVGDLDGDGVPELVANNYYTGGWTSFADTWIYWGDAASPYYDSADRTALSTYGSFPAVRLVGNTDW